MTRKKQGRTARTAADIQIAREKANAALRAQSAAVPAPPPRSKRSNAGEVHTEAQSVPLKQVNSVRTKFPTAAHRPSKKTAQAKEPKAAQRTSKKSAPTKESKAEQGAPNEPMPAKERKVRRRPPINVDASDRLYNPSEVSAILGVNVQTLANWRAGGSSAHLDFVKIGKAVRYKRSVVEAYIREKSFRYNEVPVPVEKQK